MGIFIPLSIAISIVPAAYGLWRKSYANPVFRVAFLWMLFDASQNVSVTVVRRLGYRTTVITFGAYPIRLWVAATALLSLTGLLRWKVWRTGLMTAYIILWLWEAVRSGFAADFAAITAPVEALLITAMAAYLLVRVVERSVSPSTDPALLIAVGALLLAAPAVALWPLSTALYPERADLVRSLWEGRAVFLILGYLTFAKAFMWKSQTAL